MDRFWIFAILILLIYGMHSYYSEEIVDVEIEYPSGCENLSLQDTSYCLRNFVGHFFNYTQREDTEKSVADVIENGGDCYDYSLLYEKMFKRLGFRTYIVQPFVKQVGRYEILHQYVRVEDETGYCIVDMSNVHCFKYGELPDLSNSSVGTKMEEGG